MNNHDIHEGLSVTYSKLTTNSDAFVVTDTIFNYLVSTPAIITMVIDISSKMLDSRLPQNHVTIGSDIQFSHLHATLIGETIELTLKVEKVINNKIYLDIVVKDRIGIIGTGKYERIIIDKSRLNKEAFERSKI